MKAAAATPFLSVATKAWAEPTDQLIDEVIRLGDLPPDWEEKLRKKHRDDLADTTEDELNQAVIIWAVLWKEFHRGLGRSEKDPSENWLKVAFEEPNKHGVATGKIIRDNVRAKKFKDAKDIAAVMDCAFRCGQGAAWLAGTGVVTAAHYSAARRGVEDHAAALIKRAVRLGAGKDDQVHAAAAAC